MKSNRPRKAVLSPRVRVLCGDDIALGPGKVDLLTLVARTGSIRQAAEKMDMSYMRAWTLIKTMNACFNEPLVITARGGDEHGGARLSETGKKALELYNAIQAECLKGTRRPWRELQRLLTRS